MMVLEDSFNVNIVLKYFLKDAYSLDGYLFFMMFLVFFPTVWLLLYINNQVYTGFILSFTIFLCYCYLGFIIMVDSL